MNPAAKALAAIVVFGHGVWLVAAFFNAAVILSFVARGDAADEAATAFMASGGIDMGTVVGHLALATCGIALGLLVLIAAKRIA